MVILIADAAWMAYRYTRQDSWKNVDVLLVGVKKYSLDLSEYLHPTRLSAHNFQLTQDLCRSYNATGITEDIYIPQNIQLMLYVLIYKKSPLSEIASFSGFILPFW